MTWNNFFVCLFFLNFKFALFKSYLGLMLNANKVFPFSVRDRCYVFLIKVLMI